MKLNYLDLAKQENLIEGVILRKLMIHKDSSGTLIETLRSDWQEVFNQNDLKFAMQYLSITPSGMVRDKDLWHVHKFQKDRFICISGRIVTAIFDPRKTSKTYGKLNLFIMGPENEDEMFMVVIPEETYHGFMVVSQKPGYLLNFPTQLYSGEDESRIRNQELNWQDVRNDFGL